MSNGEDRPQGGSSAEEELAALRAELEQVSRERDKSLAARDLVLREMLAPGSREEGRPSGRGRGLVWLLAVVLLGGMALLVVRSFRVTSRMAEQTVVPTRMAKTARNMGSSPRRAVSPHQLVVIPATGVSLLTRAALSPDGTTLVMGGLDGKVVFHDLRQDRTTHTAAAHEGEVRDLLFVPGGRLLTAGADGAIHQWSVVGKPAKVKLLRKTGASPVRRVALCGKLLAVAAEQPELELIPLAQPQQVRRLAGHKSWIRAVACSRDGSLLASGGHDGMIRIWSPGPGKLLRTLPGRGLWVSALAFAPDGRTLASGGFDRRVRLWDVQQGKQLHVSRGHVRWISDLAYHRGGKLLLSASVDRTVRVWGADGVSRHRLAGHRHAVNTALFHPLGNAVLSASSDGTVRIWPLPVPTPLAHRKLPPPGPGEITLRRYTNGERMRVRVVDEKGNVLPSGLKKLAWILRSGPDDRGAAPKPELVKLLYKVADHFGRHHEVWVISGYRSPEYNELRTRQSRQVGKESRHMKGEAIDIRIDDVTITALHDYVRKLRAGGVGFYPDSQFIHMDLGPVRTWGGD